MKAVAIIVAAGQGLRMHHAVPKQYLELEGRSVLGHTLSAFEACDKAVEEAFGKPPLYTREGGSIPIIGALNKALGMDCIMLGLGTGENNLHSPNESFDLTMLEKGISVSQAILKAVACP